MQKQYNERDEDSRDEIIYELKQEIKYLAGQITYLQEELGVVENENMRLIEQLDHANNIEF